MAVAAALGASVLVLFAVGSVWAFTRGGGDFNVFYEAWRLVLSGWGTEIYKATPDRFLYAPGFAWIFAPLGILPRSWALAGWCLAKTLLLLAMIRGFAVRLPTENRWQSYAIAFAGLLIVARPVLIDFQYGQVNALILGVAALTLLGHFDRRRPTRWDGVRWFALTVFAVAKLYPLPLLAIPWLATRGVQEKKLHWERIGVLIGGLAIIFLPALSLGASGWVDLLQHWRSAIYDRGLPMESHNQSFAAFLHHYLSGTATHIIANGPQNVLLGAPLLSPALIAQLALAWTLVWVGFLLGWILSSAERVYLPWLAVMIGVLVIPSHLIWKPYFVLSYPLAVMAVHRALRDQSRRSDAWGWLPLGLVFVAINLSGFDLLGSTWGARIEAASVLLFTHVALVAWVVRIERDESAATSRG